MKLKKLKKSKLPSLESLRSPIFDVNKFWLMSLGLSVVIILITGLIGFRLSYPQYSESYKDPRFYSNYDNPINIDRLKSAIDDRNKFIRQPISVLKDPSI